MGNYLEKVRIIFYVLLIVLKTAFTQIKTMAFKTNRLTQKVLTFRYKKTVRV